MSAELFQQHITRRQRLVHTLALSDVDADRQMPDPQALLIQHGGGEHVHRQVTAVLADQRPLARLVPADFAAFDQHRVTGRDRLAVTRTQFRRAGHQLARKMQVLQGHAADHLIAAVAKHLFGAGVESADHPAQIGGDDRHLRCGIQHAAQLAVRAAQFLFAVVQLLRALLDQMQGSLALADQHI